ncbi:ribosome recycling factor [Helcococcus massiliensis]|uniref:ribosome recycling factor n=1 Tax=Helcococcus massiliensis TaxID=2040290 RepID=UPI000CDF1EF0|nr:ribosome recycling factor [Helcococcus massiliensis]
MTDNIIKNGRKSLEEHLLGYKENLSQVRAGRANPSLVENIKFDYYGVETPIRNAATITVPEARLLVIQPWDASQLKEIERAVQASDLGITPSNDGKVIRLPFPELNEETRNNLAKEVKQKGEQSKVGVRNQRRDMIDLVKKAEKNKEISEDERRALEEDIQKLVDEFIKKIDQVTQEKEKELKTV